ALAGHPPQRGPRAIGTSISHDAARRALTPRADAARVPRAHESARVAIEEQPAAVAGWDPHGTALHRAADGARVHPGQFRPAGSDGAIELRDGHHRYEPASAPTGARPPLTNS